jgi:Putative peptidoglycan binding domain
VKPRASQRLLLVLGGAVVLAGLSAFVGSKMESPAQVAASARPPAPSVPRVPVRYGVLRSTVALRAEVTESSPISIGVPASIGRADPVVTALPARPGARVVEGALLLSVAERPVFVLRGAIPAFRDMKQGVKGVDVRQLQAGLRRLGLYSGGDPTGFYGPATAAAVRQLYARRGYDTIGGGVAHGEVVFLRSLPQRVLGVAVPVGGLARRARGAAVLTIGSGHVVLRGAVDPVRASGLHVGMSGMAVSEVKGRTFRVRVVGLGDAATSDPASGVGDVVVTLSAVEHLAKALLGQNVGVTLTTQSTGKKVLIVPIAAVVTHADGTSVVTVVDEHGRTRPVDVRTGLVKNGEVAVTPLTRPGLSAADSVAVGRSR